MRRWMAEAVREKHASARSFGNGKYDSTKTTSNSIMCHLVSKIYIFLKVGQVI
jgi:hypothetical protein